MGPLRLKTAKRWRTGHTWLQEHRILLQYATITRSVTPVPLVFSIDCISSEHPPKKDNNIQPFLRTFPSPPTHHGPQNHTCQSVLSQSGPRAFRWKHRWCPPAVHQGPGSSSRKGVASDRSVRDAMPGAPFVASLLRNKALFIQSLCDSYPGIPRAPHCVVLGGLEGWDSLTV